MSGWRNLRGFVLILALGAGGFCNFPAPAQAASLTLDAAVQLAVAHDPPTQNAKSRIDIGKLKRQDARKKFYPKVDVQSVYGPQLDYFGQPITNRNVHYTSLGIEQPLYTGGTLKNSVKLAESETRRFESEYRVRELTAAAEAIKAYYQTLSAQAAISQYETLLRAGEEDLKEAQNRVAAGKATRADLLEVEVKMLETQQKLSKARADYQVALSGLRKVTGLEETEEVRLAEHYPLQDIKSGLSGLLSEAQEQRPLLAYFQEDAKYQQLKVQMEKGKRLPQLSLVGRYGWQAPEVFGVQKDWLLVLRGSISFGNSTLTLAEQRTETFPNIFAFPTQAVTGPRTFAFPVRSLRYTIFDGSSNKVDMEEAKAEKTLAESRLKESQRQTNLEVKDAWAQKADSEARLTTAQKQIALAEELVKINQTKYGLGLTPLVEVFKARASLAEAKVSRVAAKNDQAIALGQLYQALGRSLVFHR
ncbi:MAG: TolC family protein [Desulfobaccales bacterium]